MNFLSIIDTNIGSVKKDHECKKCKKRSSPFRKYEEKQVSFRENICCANIDHLSNKLVKINEKNFYITAHLASNLSLLNISLIIRYSMTKYLLDNSHFNFMFERLNVTSLRILQFPGAVYSGLIAAIGPR